MTQFHQLIPPAFEGLTQPARHKVLYGGRGSGKSWAVARVLIAMASLTRLRVLCAREFQSSIADSVYRLLCDQISLLGLGKVFETNKVSIRGTNGSEFFFKGLHHNAEEIKSTEGVDICWVEEAQRVSEASWGLLLPTVRKAQSEVWVTFNPDTLDSPTYQRFVVNTPPGSWVRKVNFDENPYFPDVLRQEMVYCRSKDLETYAHVWLGEPRVQSSAQVLRGLCVAEAFTPQADWHGPYYGADWGFAVDPTTLVKAWVHERKLYIEHEAYGVGVDLDHIPALFDRVPEARLHVVRADNARPETISHLNRHGYPKVKACTKWPGSVEDGVAHLRSYAQIVVHPRCEHTLRESRLWQYKTDSLSGDVLPTLLDKHNHTMDALRYALTPLIKPKRKARLVHMPYMVR